MGFKNESNNYFRIKSVEADFDTNFVEVKLASYLTKATRDNLGTFDKVRYPHVTVLLTENEYDSIISILYSAIKRKDRYKDMTDVLDSII